MHLMRFRGGTVRDALVLSAPLVQARGWRGLAGGREVEAAAAAERAMSEARPGRQEVRQPAPETVSGLAVRDGAARDMLSVLRGARGVRTQLVVPAASSAREVERLIALPSDTTLDRLILTKVDEAESAAALASVLRDSGLKVSYLGIGQRVPDDLLRATAPHVAAALLGDRAAESAA